MTEPKQEQEGARGDAALVTALDWAIANGLGAPGYITPEDLLELRAVAVGERPWAFEHYDLFRSFGHVCFRVDGAPPANIGDVLEAMQSGPLTPHQTSPWRTSSVPKQGAYETLEYEKISDGITAVQRKNREGWLMHAEKCKALIGQGLSQFEGDSAVVIGAGKVYDIPLKELAARYNPLFLVDVDLRALTETVTRVLGKLPAHVKLVQQDVAGISDVFLERLESVFAAAGDEQSHLEAAVRMLDSYHLEAPPRLFPPELGVHGKVSSAYSVMLLSQLATPHTQRLREKFHARYPASKLYSGALMQTALKRFTFRVQHDHIRALIESSDTFVLVSDVAEQLSQLGIDGQARVTSQPLPILGAERVDELIPENGIRTATGRRASTVLAATGWVWPRVAPKKRTTQGSTLTVNGVAVSCADLD